MHSFDPPNLKPLSPVLSLIPRTLLPWIAEKHTKYLDDRIHKIDKLTDYLANCDPVASERQEFISFVDGWTRRESPDLNTYLQEYSKRFHAVRNQVEELCDRVLTDETLWQSRSELVMFWRNFTYINEIDSLHGMFLTSGRWYVNAMLPVVKVLVYCSLPHEVDAFSRNELSYYIARRVITPRFAEVPNDYDHSWERRFAALFIPILQYYDRKLLFLFNVMAEISTKEGQTLTEFVQDVADSPQKYSMLLEQGIYPPFAWHELHASRRPRRASIDYTTATKPLLNKIQEESRSRVQEALEMLAVFKEYELNYNNYNYKGRFGLVSKYQYWQTAKLINPECRDKFLDAILLDRFYDALDVIEHTFGGAQ